MPQSTFQEIYPLFLSKITDDMYMEISEEQTTKLLQELLISALPWFEFPRKPLTYTFDEHDTGIFDSELSDEEKNIIAIYMVVEWLGQQLASIENVRMKYSGSDFKFTSQANHLAKIQQLKANYEQKGFKLQRLYKRRAKDEFGIYRSTFGKIMDTSIKPNWSAYFPYNGGE